MKRAYWFPARKTMTIIHVGYDHTTATLFAEDIRVREGDPFDLSIDLGKNLRSRSKGVGTYLDARELADGAIATLQYVQLNDDQVFDRIGRHLQSMDEQPKSWRLHVALKGSHWFNVRPEVRGKDTLFLHVESALVVPPGEAPQPE